MSPVVVAELEEGTFVGEFIIVVRRTKPAPWSMALPGSATAGKFQSG
jgi:hypothetical protein